MTLDEVRQWARMMREEGIVSLTDGALTLTLGAQPTLIPADSINLDDLNHIPTDPLLDPATFSGGVPYFRPTPPAE